MKLIGEQDDAYVFQCQSSSCKLVQVVSKQGIIDKSKFDNAKKRFDQEVERRKRWESRRKIFV
jgi:hypothetical protein